MAAAPERSYALPVGLMLAGVLALGLGIVGAVLGGFGGIGPDEAGEAVAYHPWPGVALAAVGAALAVGGVALLARR